MIRNYIKVALRNIKKEKFYSLLNITGLSIGIAATLLIYLYVNSELSYDRFHKDVDRIYRVGLHGKMSGQEIFTANTCAPMAAALVAEFPEVESSTRIQSLSDEVVRFEDVVFTEDRVLFADSNFFSFFSFNFLEGDAGSALKEPNTMVLTPAMAKKYFGNEPAIGKLMTLGRFNSTYKVTGIVEEAPENSHFHYNIILSASTSEQLRRDFWLNNFMYTYFKVHEGTTGAAVEEKLPHLVTKYIGPEIERYMGMSLEQMEASGSSFGYYVEPLKNIHLSSKSSDEIEPGGDIMYVYIFIAIALVISLIACINFMNLATARSAGRAKEVGLRKTLGSVRSSLIAQFLSESLLYSILATVLAFGIVMAVIPQFNLISGKNLDILAMLELDFILVCLGMMIIVGLLAGSYPAFYLTSFQPAEVLKGKVREGMKSGVVRSGLVMVQFFISTFLIICTAVVYNQIQYFQTKNIGIDKDRVIVISNAERLQTNAKAFKDNLISQSNIKSASYTNSVFPGVNNTTVFKNPATDQDHIMGTYYADYDQKDVLNFNIIEGRYFSPDFPSDSMGVVINEAVVAELSLEDPIGAEFTLLDNPPRRLKIIGVVKDFNFEGFQGAVRPLVIQLGEDLNNIIIKYDGTPEQAISTIEGLWKKMAVNEPFEYHFMDEDFDALFRAEQRLGTVFTIFTGLAIFIACLGLIGLSAFTAQKRIKEIGVRKIMGASETSLVVLLNKEFTILVVVSFIVAAPLAYLAMEQWLNGFAYRIDIGWKVFAFAGLVTLFIAWLTVSFQSLKAAKSNPVKALRSE